MAKKRVGLSELAAPRFRFPTGAMSDADSERLEESLDLAGVAAQILVVARQATSEADLQGQLDSILRILLAKYDVTYTPVVNNTLAAAGLSQVSSDRPDSLFGHVVLDYKAPNLLKDARRLQIAKTQIQDYLDEITQGRAQRHAADASRWAGILWDGFSLVFCQSDGTKWKWSKLHPTSRPSLQTLVHIYRSLRRKPLTAELLGRAFGKDSAIARKLIPAFCRALVRPQHRTSMLFREWRRMFQQASTYELRQLPTVMSWAADMGVDTDDASTLLFATHTYYSIVVKLLSSELLAAAHGLTSTSMADAIANAPTDATLMRQVALIEDSELYRRYRITNFLEGDFFSWYVIENGKDIAEGIRQLAREFTDFEPGTAMLRPESIHDLLKQFYSSLVDEQIRHDLGEYYTPDWLAQYLLNQVGYRGDLGATLLDPTCGSGTFLVEAIARVRAKCEAKGLDRLETLKTVLRNVRGIDLNPLAVISARANYILALADLILSLGHDIELPVYLADAINVPSSERTPDGLDILRYSLETEQGTFQLQVPTVLVQKGVLGRVLLICEECVVQKLNKHDAMLRLNAEESIAVLLTSPATRCLEELYEVLLGLEEKRWDKVWCRILHNNLAPAGFGHFDYIVGNPPWVRWSRLGDSYRERVKAFCMHYGLVSGKGYSGGIESDISTVVTYSCADNWLKTGGQIAFLITFPVFKTPSARGFRMGQLPDQQGLKVRQIEDLSNVQAFADSTNATGIYIAEKVSSAKKAEFKAIPCLTWSATPQRIAPGRDLANVLSGSERVMDIACPIGAWGSPWFTGSQATYDACCHMRGRSPYLATARRGTVTDAARIFWLKVDKYSPETKRARIRTLRPEEFGRATVYETVEGEWIESDLLYPLLRGQDCGRMCFESDGWYQLIPNARYDQMLSEDDFRGKYPLTFRYLARYHDVLVRRATYRRYQSGSPFYAIYCVGDYSFAPYKVVWPEQQNPSNFRATVIGAADKAIGLLPVKPIVPDHKLYFIPTKTATEAHYLCAVLNSPPVRQWLGGFLVDVQIGTSHLEHLNIPTFNPLTKLHGQLASLSAEAHRARLGTCDKGLLPRETEDRMGELVARLMR